MKCDKCQNKAYCDEHVGIRRICKRNGYNGFVMYTNADKIRSDTDEELAEMLCLVFGGSKPNEVDDGNDGSQWLEWLKAEVSG